MASDKFFSDYYDPCPTCGRGVPDGLVPEAVETAFPQATAAAAGPAPTSAGPGEATGQRGRVGPATSFTPVKRVRQEFPEAWIWTETESRYLTIVVYIVH